MKALVVAVALVFGIGGLAACGDDDGGTVRNLNEEDGASTSGSGAGTESSSPSAVESGSPSGAATGSPSSSGSGSGSASS